MKATLSNLNDSPCIQVRRRQQTNQQQNMMAKLQRSVNYVQQEIWQI